MVKRIGRFLPTERRTVEEAEDHYLRVHSRWARYKHRDNVSTQRYYINKAIAQYDINGRFDDRKPEAWRYVMIEDDLEADPLSERWEQRIFLDDVALCIRDIVSCDAEPKVVVDHLRGQTSLAKYLFECDRPEELDPESAQQHYESEYIPRLRSLFGDAFGARLFVTNKVIRERDVASYKEPGQLVLTTCHQVERLRYDEYWFDNADWGGEFFEQREVRELLNLGALNTRGFRVDEETGLDRR